MRNSKIIQYLSYFSKKDLQRFQSFVSSPYFNKHKKTTALLNYILNVRSSDSVALAKEQVFKSLFPAKKFDGQLLSNLSSYLLKLIRQFLIQQQIEGNITEQQLALLEICLQDGQENLFELTAGRLEITFQNTYIKDNAYHHQRARYHELLDDFDLKFGNRSSGQHLEKAVEYFDIYFISQKLKMACQVLARKQVAARQYAIHLIPALLQFITKRKEKYSQIPSVWIYYLIYQMITGNDTQSFHQLKKILPTQIICFELQEGKDLYTHLLNYCIQRINFGESNFRREAFELYQQMLEREFLYVNGLLSQWDYTNVVSLGCLLNEYEWIENFIHQQKEKLSKAEKENSFNYNLASFYFSQKEYNKALTFAREVIFTEVSYDLLTRILMVKVYFEQTDWTSLEYELEKFRIFLLRNKKVTDNQKQSAFNLLRFTKSLMRLYNTKALLSKEELARQITALKISIHEHKKVLNKDWLLQMLETID